MPTMKRQRGDTIIEVFFATAIAGAVILMTLTLMNRNLATIQMATENTIVRQNIDSQAEVLRFLKDEYMANRAVNTGYPGTWKRILSTHVRNQASQFGINNVPGDCVPPAAAFYIAPAPATGDQESADIANITLQPVSTGEYNYDNITSSAQSGRGIWVEAVSPVFAAADKARYVDFHIRACWDPPYNGQRATMGTIVRLYYTVGEDVAE